MFCINCTRTLTSYKGAFDKDKVRPGATSQHTTSLSLHVTPKSPDNQVDNILSISTEIKGEILK